MGCPSRAERRTWLRAAWRYVRWFAVGYLLILLTLMIFSFLYKDNPFYKFAEHLFVGVSAGYWMVMGFWSTLWPNAIVKLAPAAARVTDPGAELTAREPLVLIPLLLGCLMLLRLWPRLAWLARWHSAQANLNATPAPHSPPNG